MLGKIIPADMSVAGNDVDDAWWKSDLAHHLGDSAASRSGVNLRGFITTQFPPPARSIFPLVKISGKFPRNYLSDHAERASCST